MPARVDGMFIISLVNQSKRVAKNESTICSTFVKWSVKFWRWQLIIFVARQSVVKVVTFMFLGGIKMRVISYWWTLRWLFKDWPHPGSGADMAKWVNKILIDILFSQTKWTDVKFRKKTSTTFDLTRSMNQTGQTGLINFTNCSTAVYSCMFWVSNYRKTVITGSIELPIRRLSKINRNINFLWNFWLLSEQKIYRVLQKSSFNNKTKTCL